MKLGPGDDAPARPPVKNTLVRIVTHHIPHCKEFVHAVYIFFIYRTSFNQVCSHFPGAINIVVKNTVGVHQHPGKVENSPQNEG